RRNTKDHPSSSINPNHATGSASKAGEEYQAQVQLRRLVGVQLQPATESLLLSGSFFGIPSKRRCHLTLISTRQLPREDEAAG
ncbi:unnamed protein product, partial [Scytosiphon promiscuus]